MKLLPKNLTAVALVALALVWGLVAMPAPHAALADSKANADVDSIVVAKHFLRVDNRYESYQFQGSALPHDEANGSHSITVCMQCQATKAETYFVGGKEYSFAGSVYGVRADGSSDLVASSTQSYALLTSDNELDFTIPNVTLDFGESGYTSYYVSARLTVEGRTEPLASINEPFSPNDHWAQIVRMDKAVPVNEMVPVALGFVTDADAAEPTYVAGAAMRLLDAQGNQVRLWTSDVSPMTTELAPGAYKLEVTSAPDGTLPNARKITIGSSADTNNLYHAYGDWSTGERQGSSTDLLIRMDDGSDTFSPGYCLDFHKLTPELTDALIKEGRTSGPRELTYTRAALTDDVVANLSNSVGMPVHQLGQILMRLSLLGYGGDASTAEARALQQKYGLSDDAFQKVTQWAIWAASGEDEDEIWGEGKTTFNNADEKNAYLELLYRSGARPVPAGQEADYPLVAVPSNATMDVLVPDNKNYQYLLAMRQVNMQAFNLNGLAQTTLGIAATKQIDGQSVALPDAAFTFALEWQDEQGNVLKNLLASTDGAGRAEFDGITITETDALAGKTFRAVVTEVIAPTDSGLAYDTTAWTVIVTPTYDAATRTVSYQLAYQKNGASYAGADALVFNNVTAKPVEASLAVVKTMDGAATGDLTGFKFQLYKDAVAQGNEVGVATTSADGTATFENAVSLCHVGDKQVFKIVELRDARSGKTIAFDESVWTVTAELKYGDPNGSGVAATYVELTYAKDGDESSSNSDHATFDNRTIQPTDPGTDNPGDPDVPDAGQPGGSKPKRGKSAIAQTGDTSVSGMVVAGLAAMGAAAVVVSTAVRCERG